MVILIQASNCNDLNLNIPSNNIPEPNGMLSWPWRCFSLLFRSTPQDSVTLSGAEAEGGRAHLQQLPPLQSQWLSGKPDKTEYLVSSVRQHRRGCRDHSLSAFFLLQSLVSWLDFSLFSLCSLVPLVALCAETVPFFTPLSSKHKFLIYSFYENPLCKETEGRGEKKPIKLQEEERGK